jgi:two-component system cell cycle response regulator
MTGPVAPGEWLAASLRGARILIIDDDRAQCGHLSRIVQEWEAIAFPAQTLADALRLYKEGNPDLVMCDVLMPHVDGYKLAQMFKRDGRFVPIILLTALDDLDSKRRGLAAGADEFLTKPVNTLELQIRVSSMLRIKRLADELEKANARLQTLATTDPLTKLANRRMLGERLAYEFARARRYQSQVACLMIDVDHFKKVNDVHGHLVGDKVLVELGAGIAGAIRTTDLGGRYGGEEFMVIAPETPQRHAVILAERLRQTIVQRIAQTAGIPPVTLSIGVATTELNPQSVEELVGRADQALYKAKQDGRDRVVLATEALGAAKPR